jgi:RNA recognition motif-containing protein
MATKLFVGKLSFSTTNESLQTLFEQFGTVVSAQVAADRETSRSRGFGFVEMENEADAQKAIEALDGTTFEERTIVVNVAKPREDRPRPQFGGGSRGGFGRRG